jgi:prevent-host-death family protein
MKTVGSYQAKTHLPKLLDRVENGERFIITKNGRAVAMLVPPPKNEAQDVATVIEQFKAYSKQAARTLGGLTARDLIEEGRRF